MSRRRFFLTSKLLLRFRCVRNPHVPGQMLKAAVPKGKGAGDKFDVKVPAPVVSQEGDKNKFPREFQELAAQFSAKYDEWCHAQGTHMHCTAVCIYAIGFLYLL